MFKLRLGAPSVSRAARVLIVDDSAPFRRVVRELLGRRGYLIAGETDRGAAAMSAARLLAPDAVLLDVHLPDENGFRLCARLVQADPALAVLMMSSNHDDSFYALAAASGARGFVPKFELAHVELARFWSG